MIKLTIGALAKRTGISVRMLRHYDDIGLLQPAQRTDAGYRLYGVDEVRRLQAILSLRQLGLGLQEIGAVLCGGRMRPLDAIELRLRQLNDEIAERQRLQRRLVELSRRIRESAGGTLDELVESVEVLNAMERVEKYFTPEQLEELKQRSDALGEAGMQKSQEDWQLLIAEVKQLVADGVPASDPRARSAADRWMGMVEAFTGGNPEIASNLQRVWEDSEEIQNVEIREVRALYDYVEAARTKR
jgi:DNA-binding transcriptional MerR regulator